MSDIESFESLEGYETLIEYEGFETPVERSLAYIEENRQERSRDLEDAQMHDDYVEMFIEVSETGHDELASDHLETLSKRLSKRLADFEKKRDETLPGTIADLERKRDEALAEYERKRDEALAENE